MVKSDLMAALVEKRGMSATQAVAVVETVLASIVDALCAGDRIEIRGFGSFHVKSYDAYQGRNPKTGEPIAVKAKRGVLFRTGRELTLRVNAAPEFDPTRGGQKITAPVKEQTELRIRAYAESHFKGRFRQLDVRFQGCFCYVDAHQEPKLPMRTPKDALDWVRDLPLHLCRLQYSHADQWGLDLFVYSSEKYVATAFPSGKFDGTPEEALELAGGFHL